MAPNPPAGKDCLLTFQPQHPELEQLVKSEFSDQEILHSYAFTGAELITVIFSASILILDKVLRFYVKNREITKHTKLTINGKQLELTGYSVAEIEEMIQSGSLEAIQKQLQKKV
ncbi:MAG: hypothetical protein AAF399_25345 [Bacteroidota bacterium]